MANLLVLANSMESMATRFVIFSSILRVALGRLHTNSFSLASYEPSEVHEVCNKLVTDIDYVTSGEIKRLIRHQITIESCYLIGLKQLPGQTGNNFTWSGSNTVVNLSTLNFDDGDPPNGYDPDDKCVCLQRTSGKVVLHRVDCDDDHYILCDDWEGLPAWSSALIAIGIILGVVLIIVAVCSRNKKGRFGEFPMNRYNAPQASTPYMPQTNTPFLPQASTPYMPQASTPYVPQASTPYVPQASTPYMPQASTPYMPQASTPGMPQQTAPYQLQSSVPGMSQPNAPYPQQPITAPGMSQPNTPYSEKPIAPNLPPPYLP